VNLTILTTRVRSSSAAHLSATARGRGHAVTVLAPAACSITFDHEDGAVWLARERHCPNVVIPRLSARTASPYALAVLRQLEAQGALLLNTPDAIELARDKMRTLQVLALRGVPVPTTVLCASLEQLRHVLPFVGGAPVIIKLNDGMQGIGVLLAEDEASVETLLSTLWSLGTHALLQRFVSECRGRDLRAFVVGGEVVAAMRRRGRPGDFRANLHQGGVGVPVELAPELRAVAIRASRLLGLEVAGVDMLEANEGVLVLEVNSCPGLRGIETATSVDVARKIVERAERLVASRVRR
jgi:ribosomal protein S6--L-glutamate ligase